MTIAQKSALSTFLLLGGMFLLLTFGPDLMNASNDWAERHADIVRVFLIAVFSLFVISVVYATFYFNFEAAEIEKKKREQRTGGESEEM